MTRTFLISFFALFASCGTAACSGDDKSSGVDGDASAGGASASGGKAGRAGNDAGSGGSSGTQSDAGKGGNASTITISGQAHDWSQQDPFTTPVLAGVEVCLYQHPEVACSTTGDDGAWALHGVPTNAEVLVSLKKTDRVPTLRAIETGTTDIAIPTFENALPRQADVAPLLPGVAVDHDRGGIVFFMNQPGGRFLGMFDWIKGFSVNASPRSGEGPFYLDAGEVLVPSATQSQGGWGHYVNMDAGEYTLTFVPPAGATCQKWADVGLAESYGYPTDDPLAIRVPVVAGFMTYPVGKYCQVPAGGSDADAASPLDAGADAR